MPIERIRIRGVRCFDQVECKLDPRKSFFFGPNGSGKTTLLEAIFLLGRGRSFRTRHTRRLIRRGETALSVAADLRVEQLLLPAAVQFSAGRLEYRLNRAPVSSVSAIAERFRVEVLDPGVHALVEGGPSERRRFLDWGLFHVEPHFLRYWRGYRRALGQRNAALKAGLLRAEASLWDAALVETGARIDAARHRHVANISEAVSRLGRALLGASLQVGYRRGWGDDLDFAAALVEGAGKDRERGFTQLGPHRAELVITLDGEPVAAEASRGQQKLVAAALVLGQVVSSADARRTTLLIDDPAAELDAESLNRLLAALDGVGGQQIYTSLSVDSVRSESRYPVFHVEQGGITELV